MGSTGRPLAGLGRLAGVGPGDAAGEDSATPAPILFTDNETNLHELFGVPNQSPYVKDAFHKYVIHGQKDAVDPLLVKRLRFGKSPALRSPNVGRCSK